MVDSGVSLTVSAAYLTSIGWQWTLNANTRWAAYRRLGDLGAGRYVLEFRRRDSGHFAALVDGELHDLDDHCCTQPVWGWWQHVAILARPPRKDRHVSQH
jgi:hypothetical protein